MASIVRKLTGSKRKKKKAERLPFTSCRYGRWFHPNLTGKQAVDLLQREKNLKPGTYLVRRSKTRGNFALTVKRENAVTHIKIENTGDFYHLPFLPDGDKFGTLWDLIEYYTKPEHHDELADTEDGKAISLKYPYLSEESSKESWWHGRIGGKEAEKLLNGDGRNGSFLVRESHKPGDLAIAIFFEGNVYHLRIICQNERYWIESQKTLQFSTISELVEHYQKTLIKDVNGAPVYLKRPLSSTRIKACNIGDKIIDLDGDDGFRDEFELLQQYKYTLERKDLSRKEGQRPENKQRNRYKNVLPYDKTRVKLRDGNPGEIGSDYINASYVEADDELILRVEGQNKYIAMQGCLPNTVRDLWRMVWQENVTIIVMVTKLVEKGKNKSVKYWPEEGEVKEFEDVRYWRDGSQPNEYEQDETVTGRLNVQPGKKEDKERYTLRYFNVWLDGVSGSPREILHYHYLAWGDHGVPEEPGLVLDFMEVINRKHRMSKSQGPIVVHCSAGIGRTGSYIIIDMIINHLKKFGIDSEIDIERTCEMVRLQRHGMVQTEDQYRFLYMAVHYYVEQETKRQKAMKSGEEAGHEYSNMEFNQSIKREQQQPQTNEHFVYENVGPGSEKGRLLPDAQQNGPHHE